MKNQYPFHFEMWSRNILVCCKIIDQPEATRGCYQYYHGRVECSSCMHPDVFLPNRIYLRGKNNTRDDEYMDMRILNKDTDWFAERLQAMHGVQKDMIRRYT